MHGLKRPVVILYLRSLAHYGKHVGTQMTTRGIADLPLHDGRVPYFLLERMKKLGGLIARYIVEVYGPRELLYRLSDPLWFQAFSNVIGMDWDSSGSTTIVLYVLKNTFPPGMLKDNEVAVLGGKGSDSRAVVSEVKAIGSIVDEERVVDASRMAAKIDGVALQDGYNLYIHGLIVDYDGKILVVQQGMNPSLKIARRYHLQPPESSSFTTNIEPHTGVASIRVEPSLNLADAESREARRAIIEIASSTPPGSLVRSLAEVNRRLRGEPSILAWTSSGGLVSGVEERRLATLYPRYYRPVANLKLVERIAEELKIRGVLEFDELLRIPGVGAETVRALALIADLIYGYKPSLRDPTTLPLDPFLYAYAHGGKDGVPYPVRVENVDKTIEFFASALEEVKAGSREKEFMLKKLAEFARRMKAMAAASKGISQRYP